MLTHFRRDVNGFPWYYWPFATTTSSVLQQSQGCSCNTSVVRKRHGISRGVVGPSPEPGSASFVDAPGLPQSDGDPFEDAGRFLWSPMERSQDMSNTLSKVLRRPRRGSTLEQVQCLSVPMVSMC